MNQKRPDPPPSAASPPAPPANPLHDALARAKQAVSFLRDAEAAADSARATLTLERKKLTAKLCADLHLLPGHVVLLSEDELASLTKRADLAKVPLDAFIRGLLK